VIEYTSKILPVLKSFKFVLWPKNHKSVVSVYLFSGTQVCVHSQVTLITDDNHFVSLTVWASVACACHAVRISGIKTHPAPGGSVQTVIYSCVQ
jgi:hypothetical protein